MHLAGIRPDGVRVPVSGMSTGTADQLYLALRVAAVEDYLDHAAPLPFVADDLFINFDDDRAAAGFQVLGQLAKKTQNTCLSRIISTFWTLQKKRLAQRCSRYRYRRISSDQTLKGRNPAVLHDVLMMSCTAPLYILHVLHKFGVHPKLAARKKLNWESIQNRC